jgi:hypothetical protein
MSHHPPGLDVGPNRPPTVRIGIKNHGNTPADVVAVVLEQVISDHHLPEVVPDFRPKTPQRFFLMPHESVTCGNRMIHYRSCRRRHLRT